MLGFRNGEIMEIIIKDETMRKLDRWVVNIRDIKKVNSIFKYLKEKYNLNTEEKKPGKEKDILDIDLNL